MVNQNRAVSMLKRDKMSYQHCRVILTCDKKITCSRAVLGGGATAATAPPPPLATPVSKSVLTVLYDSLIHDAELMTEHLLGTHLMPHARMFKLHFVTPAV